ncbi:MAG: hypothetical protein ACFHWX_00130 [Bacteroidota bacterium]
MNEKAMTNEESLALIGRMISQAKENYSKGSSFYFLLWGWIVLIANIGHYLIQKFDWFDRPYYIWVITIPAIILTIIRSIKESKEGLVTTHLDRLYGHVWIGVGIGIGVSIMFMSQINYYHNAFILLFAMIGTYVSGQMLRFRPLMLGAVAFLVASIICFNVSMVDQYLVGGIGILLGYLIPGYLLKVKEIE